jgi:hypothetical protein
MSATITLDGRLGQDPELKTTSNGKTLTRLSVVTNGRKRTEAGTWEDVDTTWWDVTLFGLVADDAAAQLHVRHCAQQPGCDSPSTDSAFTKSAHTAGFTRPASCGGSPPAQVLKYTRSIEWLPTMLPTMPSMRCEGC